MGASRKIKTVAMAKGIKTKDLAEAYGDLTQTFYNKLHRDTMKYDEVEKIADALGCDVVFRDRETGKIY